MIDLINVSTLFQILALFSFLVVVFRENKVTVAAALSTGTVAAIFHYVYFQNWLSLGTLFLAAYITGTLIRKLWQRHKRRVLAKQQEPK